MTGLLRDIRHAVRLYAATPAVSLVAIGILAVAIAFVSTFASYYSDLELKPNSGFEEAGRLVTLGQNDGVRFTRLPYALLERIAGESTTLEGIGSGGMVPIPTTIDNGEASVGTVTHVTRSYFSALKPWLALGRGFLDEEHEPDAELVVILSYQYWQDAFGGRDDVIGASVEITARALIRIALPGQPEPPESVTGEFRVVGVLGPDSALTSDSGAKAVLPYGRSRAFFSDLIPDGSSMANLGLIAPTLGRLASDSGVAAVANELNSRFPDTNEDLGLRQGARIDALAGVVNDINVQRDVRRQVRLFLAGSLLLAIVAAANVSLFLLSRAPGRQRELGIRMAIGAPERRLMRQLASEAGLLVLCAVCIGVLLSIWLGALLSELAFLQGAEWRDATLADWRSLALVSVLASGALAFSWHLGILMTSAPGYEMADRIAVQLSRSGGAADGFVEIEDTELERSMRRQAIASIPGVGSVSFASSIPGALRLTATSLGRLDGSDTEVEVLVGDADEKFADVLGLRLVRGRTPESGEANAVLVNEVFATEVWGRVDVVGETIDINFFNSELPVVGVLEDVSFGHPAAAVPPTAFLKDNFGFFSDVWGVIETSRPRAEIEPEINRLIDEGEIVLRLQRVASLEELRSELIAPDRARGLLTISSAGVVLFLAGFGFYGTQRYLVAAGRREYAIRASLGAGPRALGRLVLGRSLAMSLPGLIVGGLLAFIAVAWLREDFVSQDVNPWIVTAAVLAVLISLLLAATAGPARHARRTEPAPLLRED